VGRELLWFDPLLHLVEPLQLLYLLLGGHLWGGGMC
jgi:hypothetical protein